MKSVAGFVLGLIGSLVNLGLAGLLFFLFIMSFYVSDVVVPGSSLDSFIGSLGIWSVVLSVLLFILSIVGFYLSGLLNRPSTVKKGAIGCFVCAVLSLNVFLFIAGILGFISSMSKVEGNDVIVNY